MARCIVSISHSRIRKNFVIDDAVDDADAFRQFKDAVDLPTVNVPEGGWPIKVDWLGAAPPTPQSSAPQSVPKTAAEAIAAEVPAAPPAMEPVTLEQLKSFGIPDNDVADLEKAGLTTLSAIKAYAREHKGLTSLPGIGAVGEDKIRKAILAYEANEA